MFGNKPKGSGLGQSLASMLTSLELIPETNTTHRRYFYDFLKGLGLLSEEGRPTQKAVDMGYAQEVLGSWSWHEWDMDFFFSRIGLGEHSWLGGYMSKSKIRDTLKREKYNIDEHKTLELLVEEMRPYCECDEERSVYDMVPNRNAIESGRARLSRFYEWNPECLTRICEYFIELKGVSKSKKIALDEAKSHLSWMGKKGMSPSEEAPMELLAEVDPECFERINAIDEV